MKKRPGYPGYSITKQGQVISRRRRYGKGQGKGGGVVIDQKYCREMKPYIGRGGYVYVSVSTRRGQRSIAVHAMLLDAFVGPGPEGKESLHLDGNPQNNALDNLSYGSCKSNAADRIRHRRQKGREILTDSDVRNIRQLRQNGELISVIAKRHEVSETRVRDVVHRKTYKNVY